MFRDKLDAHLADLKRRDTISIKYSNEVPGGMKRDHLHSVDIILLLLSAEFINSDDHDREMQLAIEQQELDKSCVRLLPILVRPYNMTNNPLKDFKRLPDDESPISKWLDWDEAFVNVVNGIIQVINELRASSTFQQKKKRQAFDDYFRQGLNLYEKGLLENSLLEEDLLEKEALGIFEKALQAYPRHTDAAGAYYYIGDLLYRSSMREETPGKSSKLIGALKALEISLGRGVDNVSVYNTQGKVLQALGRYDEALVAYDMAIQRDSHGTTAYTNKGEVFLQLTSYEQALNACESAIDIDPHYARAYHCKGRTLFALDRASEALVAYKKAEQLDPHYSHSDKHHAYACYKQGESFFQIGHYHEALAEYEEAIRLYPDEKLFYCL